MRLFLALLFCASAAGLAVGTHVGQAGAAATSQSSPSGSLGFTCDYDADGTHQCWCEGGRSSDDCSRMRDSDVCKKNQDGDVYDWGCSLTTGRCTCWNTTNTSQDMPEEDEIPTPITEIPGIDNTAPNQGPEEEEDDPISRSDLPGLEDVARPSAGTGFPVPSDVVVSNRNSRGTLGVSWQDNSSTEEGFYVERLISRSSGNWETAATSRSRDGNVEDTGSRRRTLRNQGDEATLCYRVRAYWGDEISAPSETVCSRSQ